MEDFVPAGDLECQATVRRYGASDPVSTVADLCDADGSQGSQNPLESDGTRMERSGDDNREKGFGSKRRGPASTVADLCGTDGK
jgi:hypothetical protein